MANENDNREFKRFYVSLVRELRGFYIDALAYDEESLRLYLNEYYGKMWCSVYTEKPCSVTERVIGEILVVR